MVKGEGYLHGRQPPPPRPTIGSCHFDPPFSNQTRAQNVDLGFIFYLATILPVVVCDSVVFTELVQFFYIV